MSSTIVGLNGACISVRKRISAENSNESSFKRKLNFLIVPKITGCVPTQPLDLTKIKLPPNITYADAEFNIPKRIDILLGGEIFYELLKEAIGIKAESSCDPDDQAIQHFKSSVRFNSGRYEVGFPWKSHTQELNDNFSVAEKRVKSLTRRFIRDPTLYIQYSEILKEYESQGIIKRVLETEKPTDRAVFYLPHQAVFRQESLTTKMRIVFDASSHEDGQPSLNDCIWSDIERAFLQISLRDEDRDAVRFLFADIRSNQTDPYKFQVYRFKRVMFGVNVSPFLLSATIKHHIENYREQYPAATEMLDTCLYVDDVISGADDISQALKVSKDAETIMKNASMKLRKWNSNDQTLMRTWEKEGLETHPRHPDDSSKIPSSKVLGIPWDVVHDYFTIDIKGLLQLDTSKPITKRIVLQSAGKIYDPVGFLSPYTIRLKCLLQELWLRKLSWDDELPPDIHAIQVKSKSIPFPMPVKAARLAKEVKKILDQKCSTRAFFWTDSQVTLHWIKGPSHRWKPFVANRVREIQSLTDPNSWFHCSGKDNPADLLTRGISVDALTTNSKWWNGSSFLRQIDFQTKGLDEAIPERVYLTEMRKNSNPKEDISLTLTVTKNNFLENIIDISNNYVKLIRVVSFLYRFIHNCRTRITKIKGPLTSQEVSHAENWLIHSLHEREFYEELRKLLAGEPIPMKSKLTPLNVFLDESNIIRVGGRLANSNLNEKAKFPMILPSRNVLTDVILSHYHKKYLHAGPHSLLYLVRQKFWPLNGRNNCRRIIHECVNCFKNKPITMNQIMANLPRDRVTANYPFNVTGVDFAGPFFIKFKNQRKGALNRIYVVVYVCLCTKAIHLDFVTDLTSQAFIASLKRFFGRRGKCVKITTDNAKTFVGANAEIKKLFKMIKLPDHTLAEFSTNESIEWNFYPTQVPKPWRAMGSRRTLVLIKDENLPSTKWSTGRITEIFPGTDDDHSSWYSKLPVIRFAKNTTVCDTTGHTPAYLLFGRELRTVDDVVQDFKSVVHNDNFVAEITPYLKRFATITEDIRERIETKQDQRKKQYDKNRRPVYYSPGDKVWVTLHPISSAKNKKTSKFMPKRDGPYLILTQKSPTSYVIASLANPSEPIATYHTSALTPVKDINTSPVAPLRKRGRPRKVTSTSQNKHVPSPSTATTAVSNRTIHPSTRATTTTANYVSSPGRRRIHRGDCNPRSLNSSHMNSRKIIAPSSGLNKLQ
ncbi:integrase catalytic domain-containing protein [Trichonephila clavipes]|nr:integrase catalytic domain-containing protein [Trichonephila clavipes]